MIQTFEQIDNLVSIEESQPKAIPKNMEASHFKGRHIICTCETPFQMLGLLCMFGDTANRDFERCDLLVNPLSRQIVNAAMRASAEKVFTSVVYCDEPMPAPRHLGIEALFARRRMKEGFWRSFPSVSGCEYDLLLCASVTCFTLSAKLCCVPNGETYYYDDGSGSHNGNVFRLFACQDNVLMHDPSSMKLSDSLKHLMKCTIRQMPQFDIRYNISELHVFNPTVEESSLYKDIDLIEISVPDDIGLLRRVLSPKADMGLYQQIECIFFTLSNVAPKDVKEVEISIAKRLVDECGDHIVIRVHPGRDAAEFACCGDAVFQVDDSWEVLLLSGAISEDVFLVGYGSSCMTHPKQLCGFEPRVSFLYKMMGDSSSTMSITSSMLRLRYRNPEKVTTPIDYDELSAIIHNPK